MFVELRIRIPIAGVYQPDGKGLMPKARNKLMG